MNNKTLACLCLLLLPFFTVYGQIESSHDLTYNVPLTTRELPTDINNYYEGLVDNKYPIRVSITHQDENISVIYTDYTQKEAIKLGAQYIYITSYNYQTQYYNPPYFKLNGSGFRNSEYHFLSYYIMSLEVYDAETLIITDHNLDEAIGTKLYLTKQPANYTTIKKLNTADFIEQAKVKTAKEGEFDIQDLHKTRWLYPTIAHSNPTIEKEINRKIEVFSVHSVKEFTNMQDELDYLNKNNLKTILDDPIVYSTPNLQSQGILINNTPLDSLHFTTYNTKVAYNANGILQLNSHFFQWSGNEVPIDSENKLINTQTGDYITFDDCFIPQAKEFIYNYMLQHNWDPTTIDRIIADKMFGINNHGISYLVYENSTLHVNSKKKIIIVPFKCLNKYIKADGPLGVFKRE